MTGPGGPLEPRARPKLHLLAGVWAVAGILALVVAAIFQSLVVLVFGVLALVAAGAAYGAQQARESSAADFERTLGGGPMMSPGDRMSAPSAVDPDRGPDAPPVGPDPDGYGDDEDDVRDDDGEAAGDDDAEDAEDAEVDPDGDTGGSGEVRERGDRADHGGGRGRSRRDDHES